MPQIENLKKTETSRNNYLNVHRKDVIYKDDAKTTFVYAVVGILICLGAAGISYAVGKKLIA